MARRRKNPLDVTTLAVVGGGSAALYFLVLRPYLARQKQAYADLAARAEAAKVHEPPASLQATYWRRGKCWDPNTAQYVDPGACPEPVASPPRATLLKALVR